MRIPPEKLEKYLIEVFKRYGATESEAGEVSAHLVMSNLRGNDSHGTMRAPWYIEKIQKSEIVPGAPIEIERETPSSAVVNGNWGFGQPIARFAMELAIEKARKQVIACVTVKSCNHVGRIGAYTSMASKEGMVGIGTANLHGTSHVVAPYGGIDAKLPTNPISFAFPGSEENDFLVDMASCTVAEGTLKMTLNNKEKTPEGWIIDSDGNPTQEPSKFYNAPRGAILPLGGISAFKGFALSLAIDVLSGALSGAQCSNAIAKRHGNACCFIALRIDGFTTLEEFKNQIALLTEHIKSSRPAEGFNEILMPGEPELRKVKKFSKEGIVIDSPTWEKLSQQAVDVGLNVEDFVDTQVKATS